MGAFMNKGLTMKTGQTHVHRYLRPLLDRVQKGDIDPSFVVTHFTVRTSPTRLRNLQA
jgi:threonine dehydrogenase-like Zn-dependent dehydrogenase